MKLPLADNYIVSQINDDDYYLSCFCNELTVNAKLQTGKITNFYEDHCETCIYLDDNCDGGSSALLDNTCERFNKEEFVETINVTINVPKHIYIEKYDSERRGTITYSGSYLFVLNNKSLIPLKIANVHDDGEICFGDNKESTPALRYSIYWNSAFNTDLTHEDLIENKEQLINYVSNWTVKKQKKIYGLLEENIEDFINEQCYIESSTATDFLSFMLDNRLIIGLGTISNKHIDIRYL